MNLIQIAEFNSQIADAVNAVAPVTNMRISDPADSSTWVLFFAEGATKQQIDAANALLPSIQYQEKKKVAPDGIIAMLMKKGVIDQKDVDEMPAPAIFEAVTPII